jgi:hypothetical protein
MVWTKLWLLKLSLLGSALFVCVGILLREPVSPSQSMPLKEQTQQVVELSLKLSAEQLIEQATLLASDSQLVAALDERERGLAEPELLRQSVLKRLRKLLGPATEGLAQWAMLIDQDGVVVTRAGLSESRHGDSLIGWPLLQLGLRGYRLDDLYEEDGQVFEVAVAPLSTLSHERYAGAVVIGRPLDSRLGSRLGMTTVWRRNGRALLADAPQPPRGASLVSVARPGSVTGVELVGWLTASPLGPARESIAGRLRRGLTLPMLGLGVLIAVVWLGLGLGLLRWERQKERSALPFFPSFGPFPAGFPDIPAESTPVLPVSSADASVVAPPAADGPTAAASSVPALVWSGETPSAPGLAQMYADFVLAKVRCGESLSGLSFETFCDEIEGGRASITQAQGCREVAFRVHVRDGRATLRATPLW